MPNNFKVLYGLFDEVEEVDAEKPYFKPLRVCDMSVFNEIKVLEYVASKLAKMSSTMLSKTNHKEDAWLKYKKDTKLLVPFSEAFTLRAL